MRDIIGTASQTIGADLASGAMFAFLRTRGCYRVMVGGGHISIGVDKEATFFKPFSAYKECPNRVKEAKACSRPIVISDITKHHEILDMSCPEFIDSANNQQTADDIVLRERDRDALKGLALILFPQLWCCCVANRSEYN